MAITQKPRTPRTLLEKLTAKAKRDDAQLQRRDLLALLDRETAYRLHGAKKGPTQ